MQVVFDLSWCKDIENVENRVLMISFGVLAFFEESQVKQLFLSLTNNLPDGEIVFDAASKLDTLVFNWELRWTGMKKVVTKWTLKDANKMTNGIIALEL